MKMSISVPNELWAKTHGSDSKGASETVQQALELLAEKRQAGQRPMANAPDQGQLDRYRVAFEGAVNAAASQIGRALENGYRFGLLIAGALNGLDLDALDDPDAPEELGIIVHEWGNLAEIGDPEVFSYEFCAGVEDVLEHSNAESDTDIKSTLKDVLEEGSAGVRWESRGSGEWPVLSDTYLQGVMAALRDVRAEARRRLAGPSPAVEEE